MMSGLLAFCRAVDRTNSFVHRVAMWLILAAVLISAGNAIVRKVFSISSNAYLELQWYLFSAVFLLSAAYTLLRGEHVKIDIIYSRLSRKTQVLIELFGTAVFLMPLCVITVWLACPVVLHKFESGETSANAGGLILWPAWALIPIGFTLLGLQGVSEFIKRMAFLADKAPDPALSQTTSHH